MTRYVLIYWVIMVPYQGVSQTPALATATAEFESQAACNFALADIMKEKSPFTTAGGAGPEFIIRGACAPKQ